MRVAVIGAGVVGALTAYYLHRQGMDVSVYERAGEAAALTSSANGGQLSYSFCDALADPQLLSKLPSILAGRDPAFVVKGILQPQFVRWGLRFLRECNLARRDVNTLALLDLCKRSAQLMEPLLDRFGAEADYSAGGKLVLFDTPVSAELERRLQIKRDHGVRLEVLSRNDVLNLEPTLNRWAWQPRAAIYAPEDEVADARAFTASLTRCLEQLGVSFSFNTAVTRLESNSDNGCQLYTAEGTHEYDACVLATGHHANELLRPIGVRLPIVSMTGYSLTFATGAHSPTRSVTALSRRTVFSPLGNRLRVAGLADFGAPRSAQEARIETLRELARSLAPHAADYEHPSVAPWCGDRAMTPDSQPIVRQLPNTRVFTNVGHGMLGWTLAAVTGERVARLVSQVA